ncbi:putative pentatricopeptide repeat-containing protein isoform X1 [Iris pallida]|uniref:Pentatricopeptide repeat-containing protein isoform X1 n=1 Tax=Iris pallida TaxID=29817 RepID=A0AAX6DTH5_IRIPA|nr:putative pentatricopeptide repeat-containing protein isoform X1 [Iris pallida]
MTSPSSTPSPNPTSSSTTSSSRPTPTIGPPLSASLSLLHRMRRHHQPPSHPDKYTVSFFSSSLHSVPNSPSALLYIVLRSAMGWTPTYSSVRL